MAKLKSTRIYGNLDVTGTISGNFTGNASTATKLQNVRTINGTNFDGSANITTANWGTARTLTIGKTGKSVNGSGNVSWSLSEIGAANQLVTVNGFQGLALNDGTTSNWIRTTVNGIIPYESGSSSSLGTSSWQFNKIYGTTIYENNTSLADKYAAKSHNHSQLVGTSSASVTPSTGTGVMRYDYNVSSSTSGNMPNTNNANGLLTLNTHSGNYFSQLGFSSNGNLYYRNFNGSALDTTTGWKTIAFTNSNISGNAATATKLQTARTINGTNFDGSANITTANWGTARTITIGNTGKSVNGSANITWSLSEIGAAASSHTHNYAGSSSAGGNANAAVKLATARSINGTNFDGTGNITTANWGTARNIQIGNTSKSVNGSGNVSWSLSEIGAAAASHTHSYLPLSGGTLTGRVRFNSEVLLENGQYIKSNIFEDDSYISILGVNSGDACNVGNTEFDLHLNSYVTPWIKLPEGNFRMYHEGYKPKAADIGAIGTSGGTINGALTVGNTKLSGNYLYISGYSALYGSSVPDLSLGNSSHLRILCSTHFFPASNNKYKLGDPSFKWTDVYCNRGAFNGSDSKLKENIKPISRSEVRTISNNLDQLNSFDLYNYVKETNTYTFNYKNTKETLVGILADEIPQNIFNRIGIMSKTQEEYEKELETQNLYREIASSKAKAINNLSDEEIIEEVNVPYGTFKSVLENEVEPPVRMINAPAQVAMLQEVLSMSLNKIDMLEEQNQILKSELDELKALIKNK